MTSEDTLKLEKAIVVIGVSFPEIRRFLESIKIEFSTITKSCSTNGKNRISFNETFFKKSSTKELIFILMHETYHCVLSHVLRSTNKNFTLWNAACDYYINDKLILDKVGQMPNGCLYDSKYKTYSIEKIYKDLESQISKELKNFDEHEEESNEIDNDNIDELIEKMIDEEETNQSKKGYSSVQDQLKKEYKKLDKTIKKSTISWKSILKGQLKSVKENNLTYNKHNKRNSYFIFPKITNVYDSSNIYICIDISGSISISILIKFLNESINVLLSKKINTLNILVFNTKIVYNQSFNLQNNSINTIIESCLSYISNSFGGTCVKELFEYLEKNKKQQDYILVLTDLAFDYSNIKNLKNLIFVSIEKNNKSPLGKTFYI